MIKLLDKVRSAASYACLRAGFQPAPRGAANAAQV